MQLPNFIAPLRRDGRWLFRAELVYDETAHNPLTDPDHRGVLRRKIARSRFPRHRDEMLYGLPFDVSRPDEPKLFAALLDGMNNAFSAHALAAAKVLADEFLSNGSMWRRQGEALLAMLRIGGEQATDPGLERARANMRDALERFSGLSGRGSDQAPRMRQLRQRMLDAALASFHRDLLASQDAGAFAVLMCCRQFGTGSEHLWRPFAPLWDNPSEQQIAQSNGVWLPPTAIVRQLLRVPDEADRREHLLAHAARAGALYSAYITGEVFRLRVGLFVTTADENHTQLPDLTAPELNWARAVAIAERGEIYRDAAGAAFWQDLYASTQRELLQGTTQSPSRRQGGIKPMRLTRLCLAP